MLLAANYRGTIIAKYEMRNRKGNSGPMNIIFGVFKGCSLLCQDAEKNGILESAKVGTLTFGNGMNE